MLAGLLVMSECWRCGELMRERSGVAVCASCIIAIGWRARFPALLWNELVHMPNPCIELGSD